MVLHSSLESLNIILIKAIQLNPNMIFVVPLKYMRNQLKYEELQSTGLPGIQAYTICILTDYSASALQR